MTERGDVTGALASSVNGSAEPDQGDRREKQLYPDTPCMEYMPTLGWLRGLTYVNMPYMECLGYDR